MKFPEAMRKRTAWPMTRQRELRLPPRGYDRLRRLLHGRIRLGGNRGVPDNGWDDVLPNISYMRRLALANYGDC
jgi:hypothetical protein